MDWESSTHRQSLEPLKVVVGRARKRFERLWSVLWLCYSVCLRMRLGLNVFCSSAMYLERYYCRSDDEVGAREEEEDFNVFTSAVFLGVKCNDVHLDLQQFTHMLSSIMDNISEDTVISYELDVLTSIDFDLYVYSPFRVLEILEAEASEHSVSLPPAACYRSVLSLCCTPPLLRCFSPHVLAVAGVAFAADAQRNLPLMDHVLQTAKGQLLSCIAHACQFSGTFTFAEHKAVTDAEPQRGLSERDICMAVAEYLTRHDLGSLRCLNKQCHNHVSKAFWSHAAVAGTKTEKGMLGFHRRELALLRKAGLQLAYTGTTTVASHAFSDNGAAVMAMMHGTRVFKNCKNEPKIGADRRAP
eukprot:TRINITY_DN42355_c0_g1_i1.p1 TRINITY_DN42355_c0_g1~~TRINITY_DN42355_c0_g1_i1.p1  ORF type:complete len:367 (+),score=64.99 TRINITY_DN42355_c0_g1_i1:32-1102(+)